VKPGYKARQRLCLSSYPHRSEIRRIARRVWRKIWIDEIFGRAAQLAYFWFFSLFPFLILLTAIASLSRQEGRLSHLINESEGILPAEAYGLLITTFNQVTSRHHQGILSFSLLALLWAASAGMESIITSLNRAYDTSQSRPWWREKLLAILLTLGFGLFFLGAIVLLNFGELISREITNYFELGRFFLLVWPLVKWLLIMLFVLLGVELIYFFAPNYRQRWQLFTPGTIFALIFWLNISFGFRWYVTRFSNFDLTYGALGGVMMLMLWLYLTGVAILMGGEINAVLRD
jgi:membrane protein